MKKTLFIIAFMMCFGIVSYAQDKYESYNRNKFKQLKEELATPNAYRTAAGAPGYAYYQQQADYVMEIVLNDENQSIQGSQTITYHNNSPDPLDYLWVQLDQNVRAPNAMSYQVSSRKMSNYTSFARMEAMHREFDGGFKIESVLDSRNRPMEYIINETMMRVNLDRPLQPKKRMVLKIKWHYNINDRNKFNARSGYEYFPEDDNYLYTIAQFFPRMAVYNDVEGWQNKQFLGRGEFALPFGNYQVSITVPADHVVSATGVLQNNSQILTKEQNELLERAKTAEKPVIIISEEEARNKESKRAKTTKTWVYKAENVRDFAFVSSRKFIWDAVGVPMSDNRIVMAMSLYPKEGNPLWERYSTRAIVQTLKTYSRHTFDYPYPVAISVHTARVGMEYPMICFNRGRPEKDGTYTARTKYGMISVIIHEIGHNYFPMIVNSDERQWTWMDEGLNSFLQYVTEQEWDRDYPSRRGPPANIVDYMKGEKSRIMPIMTNSESIYQFGNNAYGKPATALNILRETVMGRELFDYAFKQYSQRWMFKHPTPADFFRTMEDASAVDLDWFWRGWFYTNNHVDQSLLSIRWLRPNTKNPRIEKPRDKEAYLSRERNISDVRDDLTEPKAVPQTVLETDPIANDFYDTYDPFAIIDLDEKEYQQFLSSLNDEEKKLLNGDYNYYEITVGNVGGLVMPIILKMRFKDNTEDEMRIPAEIWKLNDKEVSKIYYTKKELAGVTIDPYLEIADTDRSNNYWPYQLQPTRFEVYKRRVQNRENTMQRARRNNQ